MLQSGKNTPDEIAKICNCGRTTVFRVKKEIKAPQKNSRRVEGKDI